MAILCKNCLYQVTRCGNIQGSKNTSILTYFYDLPTRVPDTQNDRCCSDIPKVMGVDEVVSGEVVNTHLEQAGPVPTHWTFHHPAN